MTVHDALAQIRRVGTVTTDGGKLRIRIPAEHATAVAGAVKVLAANKVEAIRLVGSILASLPPETPGILWEQWFADQSNAQWIEEGVTGQPGRLKPETVRHGLEAYFVAKIKGTVQ